MMEDIFFEISKTIKDIIKNNRYLLSGIDYVEIYARVDIYR